MRQWRQTPNRSMHTAPVTRAPEGEEDSRLAARRLMRAVPGAEVLVGKWFISFQEPGGPAYRAGQVVGRAADLLYLIRYESAVGQPSQQLVAVDEMERQAWEFFDSQEEMLAAWAQRRQRGLPW